MCVSVDVWIHGCVYVYVHVRLVRVCVCVCAYVHVRVARTCVRRAYMRMYMCMYHKHVYL